MSNTAPTEDENWNPNAHRDVGNAMGVVASPIAPRFAKETQRGAKRAIDVSRYHQELAKRKMVREWDVLTLLLL